MRRRILVSASIALAATGLMAQVAGPSRTALGPTLDPPDATLVAAGPLPSLTLLYTGDTIGYVDPCG